MKTAHRDAVRVFLDHGGILRMSQAIRAGISRATLYAMRDAGLVEAMSRGVYRLTSLPGLEQPDLVAVSTRVPRGVVCLISALAYHELTDQIPHAVDVAIARGTQPPRIDYPPVSVHWFSEPAFSHGVETHEFDGVRVRIYSPEKSIADAFKYRNKLGVDVAVQALRIWRGRRGIRMNSLLESARACRVERVIRPYLEATS